MRSPVPFQPAGGRPVMLPGHSAPAAGFEAPFEMLATCHERVERMLKLQARLQQHLLDQGCDASARQAARDVMRYFDIAAPLHHQDEELHVFPLLRAQASPDVQTLVQRLQQDHLAMTADWAAARVPLLALAESAVAPFTPGDEAALDRFAQRYADHIAAEEGTAYPAAQALLAPAALVAMGQEMAARRGA